MRGWIAVLGPRAMRCVPVREAESAIMRVEERVVGGLGAGGAMEARLDAILKAICCMLELKLLIWEAGVRVMRLR